MLHCRTNGYATAFIQSLMVGYNLIMLLHSNTKNGDKPIEHI